MQPHPMKPNPTTTTQPAGHTPGPWNYDTDDIGTWINTDSDPAPIAKMGKCTHFNTQANASLIAAAPEMLEALEKLEARITAAAHAFYVTGTRTDMGAALAGWKEENRAARAILARARGANASPS